MLTRDHKQYNHEKTANKFKIRIVLSKFKKKFFSVFFKTVIVINDKGSGTVPDERD